MRAGAESSRSSGEKGENVFTMVRRIGQAKAHLAADYAQLARSVGKVVFFAKHRRHGHASGSSRSPSADGLDPR
jgi:hypothetical protein